MATASLIALAAILVQGLAMLGFLRFVKSFGRFADAHHQLSTALLTMHESNLLLHTSNLRVLDELKAAQTAAKREAVA